MSNTRKTEPGLACAHSLPEIRHTDVPNAIRLPLALAAIARQFRLAMNRFWIFAGALALAALPALAADWTRYTNARFGAGVDIPSGYTAEAPAAVDGDGKIFRAGNGRSHILVWGGPVAGADFSGELRERIAADEADGWAITYRSETPDWAAWGGARGGQIFYAKSIATCDGRQTANVRLTYPAIDVPSFDSIANRLGQSLAQDGACY